MVWTPPPPPTFATACDYVLPLGKRKGETIGDVSKTVEGLSYLDYWRAMLDYRMQGQTTSANEREIYRMLTLFLDDPVMTHKVAATVKRMRRFP